MARRKKYALCDSDILLGYYTSKEISEMIGISRAAVSAYAASGARYKRRYTMEGIDLHSDSEEPLEVRWDRVRTEALERLRGGGAVGHQNNQKITGRVQRDKTKACNTSSRGRVGGNEAGR